MIGEMSPSLVANMSVEQMSLKKNFFGKSTLGPFLGHMIGHVVLA